MRISHLVLILVILVFSFLFESCCRPKPIVPPLVCGTNQMPVNNVCVCDSNSTSVNGNCEFVIGGWSVLVNNGAKYCFKTISKNCGDWRDSIFIPFTDNHFKAGSHTFVAGISSAYTPGGEICTIDYYKELNNYDTLATDTWFKMTNGDYITIGMFMSITKARDSIYADICKTKWPTINTPYKRLDTCKTILIRAI